MNNNYIITVTGDPESLVTVSGTLVCSSAGLSRQFATGEHSVRFAFRFRGDARLVLRRTSRKLTGKDPKPADSFTHRGATATITKVRQS